MKIMLLIINITILFSMTGDELVILMDNRDAPKDISSELNMEIINKKGRKRTSKIKSISKDNNKKQLLWFLSPADDKGISYLKIEHNIDKLPLLDFEIIKKEKMIEKFLSFFSDNINAIRF